MKKLDEVRERLLKTIMQTDNDLLNAKMNEHTWSIGQVLHHLYLTEEYMTNGISRGLSQNKTEHVSEKPIHLVLDRSIRVEAIRGTEPSVERINRDELLSLLESSRKRLYSVIDSIQDPSDLRVKTTYHPYFKELSIQQGLDFLAMHELRHIEQIIELQNNLWG